mgnify:FL=1
MKFDDYSNILQISLASLYLKNARENKEFNLESTGMHINENI